MFEWKDVDRGSTKFPTKRFVHQETGCTVSCDVELLPDERCRITIYSSAPKMFRVVDQNENPFKLAEETIQQLIKDARAAHEKRIEDRRVQQERTNCEYADPTTVEERVQRQRVEALRHQADSRETQTISKDDVGKLDV